MNDNSTPVCESALRTLLIEANHTAPRQQRHDTLYAQLHGFLYGVIRTFTPAYALGKPYMNR